MFATLRPTKSVYARNQFRPREQRRRSCSKRHLRCSAKTGSDRVRKIRQPRAMCNKLKPEQLSPELILSSQVNLPPLDECCHFVNLTNGLEMVPILEELGLPYSFIRLQSTACEQDLVETMMQTMDANFLMNLAVGRCCLIYDFGSRMVTGQPSSFWKGLEFVRFITRRYFLARPSEAFLKGRRVTKKFDYDVNNFSEKTKNLMRYYKKYVPDGMQDIQLYGFFRPTAHDEDKDYYVGLVKDFCTPGPGRRQGGNGGVPRPELEDWGNARAFWENRGFRMHAGGICQSLYEPLWSGEASLKDASAQQCSFPVAAYRKESNR
ncbi:hypothetical protein BSKO_08419 [Bryopsis sp. KO-2023]|nr:hypothetical protein BSKO_08419 [Bryopsis sp. KO-2023]